MLARQDRTREVQGESVYIGGRPLTIKKKKLEESYAKTKTLSDKMRDKKRMIMTHKRHNTTPRNIRQDHRQRELSGQPLMTNTSTHNMIN